MREKRWKTGKDFRCKKNGLANGGKGVMRKTEIAVKEVRKHGCLHAKGRNQWKQTFNVKTFKKN